MATDPKKIVVMVVKYIGIFVLAVATVFLISPYLFQHSDQLAEKQFSNLEIKPNDYGISETIRAVKSELYDAQLKMIKNQEAALFQAESFDLELNFVVRGSGGASIEAKAPQFLVVGETSEYSSERVQKIKLHFTVLPGPTETGSVQELPVGAPVENYIDLSPHIPKPSAEEPK